MSRHGTGFGRMSGRSSNPAAFGESFAADFTIEQNELVGLVLWSNLCGLRRSGDPVPSSSQGGIDQPRSCMPLRASRDSGDLREALPLAA